MNVDSIGSSYSNYGNDPTATTTAKKTTLDSNDFMKLLATQFQSQDPMKPMEDTAFIAQMAQFTALEQSNSMVAQLGLLHDEQQQVLAQSYLGQTLTVSDGQGGVVTGKVIGIEHASDGPRVVIGNNTYALSSVLLSEPAAAPDTQQPADAQPPVS